MRRTHNEVKNFDVSGVIELHALCLKEVCIVVDGMEEEQHYWNGGHSLDKGQDYSWAQKSHMVKMQEAIQNTATGRHSHWIPGMEL